MNQSTTPEFAVHIMEDGSVIGSTGPTVYHQDAQQRLWQMQRAFPDSVLVMRHNGGVWLPADEQTIKRLVYRRTYAVLGEILGDGLPLLSWSLEEYRPEALKGTISCQSEQEARAALDPYLALFDGAEVSEEDSGDYFRLKIATTWRGVEFELRSFAHHRATARVEQIVGAA